MYCPLTFTPGDTSVRQAGRQALQGQEMATGSPTSNRASVAASHAHSAHSHSGLSVQWVQWGSGGGVAGPTPSVPLAPRGCITGK